MWSKRWVRWRERERLLDEKWEKKNIIVYDMTIDLSQSEQEQISREQKEKESQYKNKK